MLAERIPIDVAAYILGLLSVRSCQLAASHC